MGGEVVASVGNRICVRSNCELHLKPVCARGWNYKLIGQWLKLKAVGIRRRPGFGHLTP